MTKKTKKDIIYLVIFGFSFFLKLNYFPYQNDFLMMF
ncbi:Hypothetical Protein SLY_0426 [Strawberry lethal yellows phytoplasma (CPA) str. NZSb11]|uniref:Uncharacterized protein n=1 Tax=Strawberry lethal yellows phytoplasma (CPA) str. NZSb11 TaxID=980422 RepID=R4RWU4_PHYAS|nr:Hypothetical Protein SLY_0426 [Strawberry lethal yellows phytoplasma (CPA) str. NZSb11]